MKSEKCYGLVIALFLIGISTFAKVFAQEESFFKTLKLAGKKDMPIASIEDVSWIAGHWCGEMFGGVGEEIWSEPYGGTMMGMFKHVTDDAVTFYELMIIIEETNSLILKLKHFNSDLTAWEEKEEMVDFPLVKITLTEIFFDGLTFRKVDNNTIQCVLLQSHGDDKPTEVEWIYRRVNNTL